MMKTTTTQLSSAPENIDLKKKQNIYSNRYADTSKRFRGFGNLMLQWKGSVMKLIWHDLLLFLAAYFILELIYENWLTKDPNAVWIKEVYEICCIYSGRFKGMIPVTFLTGFYVAEVVKRYWDQFMTLPFPDQIALKLVTYVPGKDSFRRNLRRTVMRYVNLSNVLVFRLVSAKVQARFPDYQSLVNAKLMLPKEVERMMKSESETPHEATWTPILWALKLLQRARTEEKLKIEAPIFANLVSSFDEIEKDNRKILNYGWVNFPLAYVQVATLSVYMYIFFSLFSSQYLDVPEDYDDKILFPNVGISFSIQKPYEAHTPDIFAPIVTLFEIVGYLGWIKVAETLLNPFGDDDEDFEINYLIDRNVQVSYLIVDDADMEMEMAKDPFLEAGIAIPAELPYQDDSQRENSARMVLGQFQRLESVIATPASHQRANGSSVSEMGAEIEEHQPRSQSLVTLNGDTMTSSASSSTDPLILRRLLRLKALKNFAVGTSDAAAGARKRTTSEQPDAAAEIKS